MEKLGKKSNDYIKFTFFFAVLSLFIYALFLYDGRTFVKHGDGFRQHVMAMIYYGRYLRSLFSGIVPQWDFNIGEGCDIIQTINYYALGDPFDFLAIFFPAKYMYICYDLISLLKMYCAGLAFIYLCKYTKVQSRNGIMVGALSYCFCFFATLQSARHPFFLNPLVYMPLMVVGIKKAVEERKPILFTAVVAVCAYSNFYFFYMTVILTVIFVAVYLICRNGSDIKSMAKNVGYLICFALLGVGMAAVLLLPVINFFISDPRAHALEIKLLYPLKYYVKLPVIFFVPQEESNLYMGYSCIIYMALISLFMNKGNRLLKVVTALCIFFVLEPLFSQLINGMTYTEARWCWSIALVLCYTLALQWDNILSIGKKNALINACIIMGYFVFFHAIYPKRFHLEISIFIVVTFFVMWLVYAFAGKNKEKCIILLALLPLVVNANYNYFDLRDKFVKPATIDSALNNEIQDIKRMGGIDFYRFSDDSEMPNLNMVTGLSSPSFYWTITNKNIQDYRTLVCSFKNGEPHFCTDYDSRAVMESLAGVKYYIAKDKNRIPYGFEPTDVKNVYKSPNNLPFGYTYDRYITRDDFAKLPFEERQLALLEGVVLDERANLPKLGDVDFDGIKPDVSVECSAGVEFRGDRFIVNEEDASVKLRFKGIPECEYYLCFKNLDYKTDDYMYVYYLETDITRSDNYNRRFVYTLPRYSYYLDTHDFHINLGYLKKGESELKLTFDKTGEYTFDSMEIICQPMKSLPSRLNPLKKNILENVVFGNNCVSGDIKLAEKKALLLQVPYADGWRATVDGKAAKLYKANIMNMALIMEPGEHSIELHYTTPFLKLGAIISAIAFVLFVLVVFRKNGKS